MNVVEGVFSEVRLRRILGSSLPASNTKLQQRYGHLAYIHAVLPPRHLGSYSEQGRGVGNLYSVSPPTGRKLCSYDEAHLYVDGPCVDGCGCYGPIGGGPSRFAKRQVPAGGDELRNHRQLQIRSR